MNNIVNLSYEEKKQFHQSQVLPKKPNERYNEEQRLAIYSNGENILVSAGAGSGKTAVLSERIIQKVINGTHLKDLIVLTFTKDAATEMKERVRSMLNENLSMHPEFSRELDEIDNAHIETIDAFCLSLVKQYHYLLDVSKDIIVGDENYLKMMKKKILRKIFDDSYDDEKFIKFIKTFCIKDDNNVLNSVLEIFNKINEQPDTEKYIETYIDNYFNQSKIEEIKKSYLDIVLKNIANLLDLLYCFDDLTGEYARSYAEHIEQQVTSLRNIKKYEDIKRFFEDLHFDTVSKKKATDIDDLSQLEKVLSIRKKINDFKNNKLLKPESLNEIVDQYLSTKENVKVIIDIIKKFNQEYQNFIKENSMYDFFDITKLSLKLLNEHPEIVEEIKNKTNEILVDEYQDTSKIQDELIELISDNNLFLVGDIKQSIYRFRHASPEGFRERYNNYSKGIGGFAIDLSKNFRSREEVLNNINLIFDPVMNQEFGGVTYHPNHELRYGFDKYDEMNVNPNYNMDVFTFDNEIAKELDINRNELEIRIVIEDILKKIKDGYQVYDKEQRILRPISLKDFVILVQGRKSYRIYKQSFEEYGIPFVTDENEDFLNSEEIYFLTHTLSLAWSVKNNDFSSSNYFISLLGFLRSFAFDYSDEKISNLLLKDHSFEKDFPVEFEKIQSIIEIINTSHLSDVISSIYEIFDVNNRINKLNNVQTRLDKLNYLYIKSRSFESTNITIPDFIDYVDYLRENEDDLDFSGTTEIIDAVHIMTIHKSKGLEFPYCYFIGFNNEFSKNDVEGNIVYNNKFGVCVSSFDDGLIESPIKALVNSEFKNEDISERIRLLYVAFTRAREHFAVVIPSSDKDNDSSKLNDGIRSSYKSFDSIMTSVYDLLAPYKTIVNLEEYTGSIIQKPFEPIKPINRDFIIHKININEEEIETAKVASHKLQGLIDEETSNNLELGNYYHELLEIIPIKEYQKYLQELSIKEDDIKILQMFYQSDLIKSLNIINEYHEYPFVNDNLSGIIDLLIETPDEYIVIDYKTYHIDKDYYQKQVNTYMDYIRNRTGKKVSGYLYSIIQGIFNKVN